MYFLDDVLHPHVLPYESYMIWCVFVYKNSYHEISIYNIQYKYFDDKIGNMCHFILRNKFIAEIGLVNL